MLKTVIIDDEAAARRILKELIQEYCEGIEVISEAEDVLSGVKEINKHKPDVVFLDIEMPEYTGFKLIEYFDNFDFEVVFTTAYERYALQAFKSSASGYLLKPIDIDDLIKVVKKIQKRKVGLYSTNQTNVLSSDEKRIVLPASDELVYLYLDQICYLESEGRYTNIVLMDNTKVRTTKTLKNCQALLSQLAFLRIHRSYIINLSYIKQFNRGRDSFILMENGTRIDVGKNYKEELMEAISCFLK